MLSLVSEEVAVCCDVDSSSADRELLTVKAVDAAVSAEWECSDSLATVTVALTDVGTPSVVMKVWTLMSTSCEELVYAEDATCCEHVWCC